MEKIRMKLSPPWITFVNELKAMFGDDPQIKIMYNENTQTVNLYVDDIKKATALMCILPDSKEFGSIVLDINVLPPNGEYDADILVATEAEQFELAFEGNPALAFIRTVLTPFMTPWTYVVFINKIVQFFNDNLNDIYGNISILYQDIARDIFGDASVCFCTDVPEGSALKTENWP